MYDAIGLRNVDDASAPPNTGVPKRIYAFGMQSLVIEETRYDDAR
jgi:hypothetical protein